MDRVAQKTSADQHSAFNASSPKTSARFLPESVAEAMHLCSSLAVATMHAGRFSGTIGIQACLA
jgi:hypothetical protein